MTVGGGADVIVVGDEGALVEALEAGDVLICFCSYLGKQRMNEVGVSKIIVK